MTPDTNVLLVFIDSVLYAHHGDHLTKEEKKAIDADLAMVVAEYQRLTRSDQAEPQ